MIGDKNYGEVLSIEHKSPPLFQPLDPKQRLERM
jgi:hypothetical protein